jgi:hypothetical protein
MYVSFRLKNYKTSDGKPVNVLKHDEPTSVSEAIRVIQEVNGYYKKLISGNISDDGKKASIDYKLPNKQ